MHRIIEIQHIEEKTTREGDLYYKVHALLDNQDEVTGFATSRDDYKVGDEVMSFFDDRWNQPKMQKPV